MACIKPFKGVRPAQELADRVASPPYDVLNTEEARLMAGDNDISFLHINKPEIDLPAGTDPYDTSVYEKGSENLKSFMDKHILLQDAVPCFYIYRQIMETHTQTGIVAGASVEEYQKDLIKKHELTRPVKEDDRVNHILALNAQTGPVFLTYRASAEIDSIVAHISGEEPTYDFTAADGIRHTLWVVDSPADISRIESAFDKLDCLYVADGHHRSAAASRVCEMKKDSNPTHTGNEAYNYFLSVIFPDNQMYIMDYNRVVTDLNGMSPAAFIEKVSAYFTVKEHGATALKPETKHIFSMYLEGTWYRLAARKGTFNDTDPVNRLDAAILQNNLLHPLLGIRDPRKDRRIDFVGGMRGLGELKRRVDSGDMAVAFALYPTSIEDLMSIADAGQTMPPKSTWFEPKLRSGLVIRLLD